MQQVSALLFFGNLSPQVRIWTALAPALLLSAYFLGGLLVYAIRARRRGVEHDLDLERRAATPLLGTWLRLYFAWLMRPLWRLLVRSGLSANAITTISLLLAIAGGVSLAVGRFALGGWLYILAGICDFFDGRLARHRGEANHGGGIFDSVLDRYSDAAVLIGLAWYYRESWVLLAVLLAMVGSLLIPYVRARGEASGVEVKDVGLMQRAERVVCLGLPTAVSPVIEALLEPTAVHPPHRVAIAGIVLLAVGTQLTALRRLLHVLARLRGSRLRRHLVPRRRRTGPAARADQPQ